MTLSVILLYIHICLHCTIQASPQNISSRSLQRWCKVPLCKEAEGAFRRGCGRSGSRPPTRHCVQKNRSTAQNIKALSFTSSRPYIHRGSVTSQISIVMSISATRVSPAGLAKDNGHAPSRKRSSPMPSMLMLPSPIIALRPKLLCSYSRTLR